MVTTTGTRVKIATAHAFVIAKVESSKCENVNAVLPMKAERLFRIFLPPPVVESIQLQCDAR
jgi:hypothetical protein